MRTTLGVESKDERMKALKEGDVIFSAGYDHGAEEAFVDKFLFKKYLKAPVKGDVDPADEEQWAQVVPLIKDAEGNVKPQMRKKGEEEVEDLKAVQLTGYFPDEVSALEALRDFLGNVVKAVVRKLDEVK